MCCRKRCRPSEESAARNAAAESAATLLQKMLPEVKQKVLPEEQLPKVQQVCLHWLLNCNQKCFS
jgi:hypothetical protein